MRVRILIVTLLVLGLAAILGSLQPSRIRDKLVVGVGAAASSPPTPTSLSLTSVSTSLATETPTTPRSQSDQAIATPTVIARATLQPVFTPTTFPTATGVVPTVTSTVPRLPAQELAATASASTQSTATPQPPARPLPIPTSPPTATAKPSPTPMYDFVVSGLKEIPRAEYRDVAYIRGRLVNANGELVKGAHFEIKSDAIPNPWTAVYPFATIPADGTAVFPVSKGTFAVRVLGGRSEDAGWMRTGQIGIGPMSDWEFTFVTT